MTEAVTPNSGTGVPKVVKHSRRAVLTLGWISGLLTILLIPHLALAGVHGILAWPPGILVVHTIAAASTGLAAIVIACARARDDREAQDRQTAYDAGRVHAISMYIDEFEQRNRQ